MSTNRDSAKFEYIDTWVELFGQLLGWTEEQTLRWVNEKYIKYLDDPDDMIYHGDPVYWAADELVPKDLQSTLSAPRLIQLQQKIVETFWGEYHTYAVKRGTDLAPFRLKTEYIFDDFRGNIILPKND